MGIPVLVLGESGSGKSASMRNFSPDEIGIFNVASKPLPFRNKLKKVDGAGYPIIFNALNAPKLKRYVVDDSQFLLCFELFDKIAETGYQKFTTMAANFYNLIMKVIRNTPEDCIVYFLHHTELDANGRLKAKTIGKMLDEKLTVEGLFSIVLLAVAETDGTHKFITQSNGISTAKTPMGMFEEEIDNDLKFVDDTIREYYGFKEEKPKKTEEKAKE